MSLSVEQFGKALIAAGLWSASEIKAFWASIPAEQRPKDGDSFASVLIEREKLTKFQADELLSGNTTPLVLGDYVLLAKIGAGGMGQVFKARHRHMKRPAAIKLLPPAMTKDEAAVKRFQREVEAAAKLSHPNIVQTYDAGVQRGVWYLVMEYVEGRDLAGVVAAEGPLSIARAVDCIRQTAKGLAYAHKNGVVHRDIKPANLLLDKEGTVKILDMGLARFVEPNQEGLTESGQVMGTVDYMAPEQAFDIRTVDGRADIYSLGCTLYRLLTNRNMYDADSLVQKLMAHQNNPLPRLTSQRSDVPQSLVAIFEKMVAKTPADRYQTMLEVENALSQLMKTDGRLRAHAIPATTPVGQPHSLLTIATASAEERRPKVSPSLDVETPTVSLSGSQATTDFIPDRSIVVAPQTSPVSSPFGSRWKRTAAVFAVVILAVALLVPVMTWQRLAKLAKQNSSKTTIPEARGASSSSHLNASAGIPPKRAVEPFSSAEARNCQRDWASYLGKQTKVTNSIGMALVVIPPGEYVMGSSSEEVRIAVKLTGNTDEQKRIAPTEKARRVTIEYPFMIGATEVTVGQFRKFIDSEKYVTEAERYGFGDSAETTKTPKIGGEQFGRDWRRPGYQILEEFPVTQVTWRDATAFCKWLSKVENVPYALPSEEEWEYACRAGTRAQFSFGDDPAELSNFAWYRQNSSGVPHRVGLLLPNGFGVHDMHGNVFEWCRSVYVDVQAHGSDDGEGLDATNLPRAVRGGGFPNSAFACRNAHRWPTPPTNRGYFLGFRVVLNIQK